ncbi:MAG: M23 family peptidase [Alphaproteobacteria bacterium]|nr:MAG: M23 family peptidase [Alphaproteobacteria bacterium]
MVNGFEINILQLVAHHVLKNLNAKLLSNISGRGLVLPIVTVTIGAIAGAAIATAVLLRDPAPDASVQTADISTDQSGATASQPDEKTAPPEISDTGAGNEAVEATQEPELTPAAFVAPKAESVTELVKTISVGKGDTLMRVLTRAGANRTESHEAIAALNEVFDPRSLRVGQNVTLYFDAGETSNDASPSLVRIALKEDVDKQLAAVRTPDEGFTAQETVLDLDKKMVRAGGVIDSSLFLSAAQAGIPPKTIVDMIRIFSYDVDFQREIQPGDKFEVYFERFADENGQILKDGVIRWASMTLSGKTISIYRYKTADDGFTDYYDEKGRSVKKTLMRTPIDGARLTSGFGKREHPVLGYTKMHRGVDFGARRGTPIMAAGNGIVERASRFGSYGNYVRIRHNSEYKTAYAHMKKFAKGIHAGSRVKQGQIIGYVGTTGRSTGPHLHYEVLLHDKQINPMSVKLPAGRKLGGKMLQAFNAYRADIDQNVAATPLETQLAGLK